MLVLLLVRTFWLNFSIPFFRGARSRCWAATVMFARFVE